MKTTLYINASEKDAFVSAAKKPHLSIEQVGVHPCGFIYELTHGTAEDLFLLGLEVGKLQTEKESTK